MTKKSSKNVTLTFLKVKPEFNIESELCIPNIRLGIWRELKLDQGSSESNKSYFGVCLRWFHFVLSIKQIDLRLINKKNHETVTAECVSDETTKSKYLTRD